MMIILTLRNACLVTARLVHAHVTVVAVAQKALQLRGSSPGCALLPHALHHL
jgi:hypothetical protein